MYNKTMTSLPEKPSTLQISGKTEVTDTQIYHYNSFIYINTSISSYKCKSIYHRFSFQTTGFGPAL